MADIETTLKHWHTLSEEEKNAIRDKRDYPILCVIDGLSPDERKRIYDTIQIHPTSLPSFMVKQKEWLSDFVYYLDENLKRRNLAHSPEVINDLVLDEIINGSMHERFRLYWAARNRSEIMPSDSQELTDYLTEVDKAIELLRVKSA